MIPPSGYLLCNGDVYDTNTSPQYDKLRIALNNHYGGSGSLFAVPNFQGAFLRGKGSQTKNGVQYFSNIAQAGDGFQPDAVLSPNTPTVTNRGWRTCGTFGTNREVIARFGIDSNSLDFNTGINVNVNFPRQSNENRPMNYAVKYWIRF